MNKLYVGIDPSINSTGLAFRVIRDGRETRNIFYQITPKNKRCSSSVKNILYKKIDTNTKNYTNDDLNKVINGQRLGKAIVDIISNVRDMYSIDEINIRIEGSIFSFNKGQSRLNDMVSNNTMIKFYILKSKLYNSIDIIPPTSLKKSFSGNGKASKDMMLERLKELVPSFDLTKGKNDDIADAFGLAYIN